MHESLMCSASHSKLWSTITSTLFQVNKAIAQATGFRSCLLRTQDGMIEDYYGQGRHAHKLIVDLHESEAVKAFLKVQGGDKPAV